jgi:dTDP-4-dehydrorhamnose reductase
MTSSGGSVESRSQQRVRVLILGANGFLGSNLALAASATEDVVLQSRRTLRDLPDFDHHTCELTSPGQLEALIARVEPGLVVNCAALADVDECERDPKRAFEINAEFPARLADSCHASNIPLVHISTDAVFGAGRGPFFEDSKPSPVNVYGFSKLEGELETLRAFPRALIVRTNFFGWSPQGSRSLLEFFFNNLEQGKACPGFQNVLFRPWSVANLWPFIREVLPTSGNSTRGQILHATGSSLLSKYDFGLLVAEVFRFDPSLIEPQLMTTSRHRAPRAKCLDVVPSIPRPDEVDKVEIRRDLQQLKFLAENGLRNDLRRFNVSKSE